MNNDPFKISDEVIAEIDKALDSYEKQKAGLPDLGNSTAPKWLSMNIHDLSKKTPDELGEAVYELAQYSMYIQRLINKNKAFERWASSKLDEVTSAMIPQYDNAYGFNERMLMAKNQHPACKKLNSFLRKVQMENDRLWGIPSQIKIISEAIRDIKFAVMRNNNG